MKSYASATLLIDYILNSLLSSNTYDLLNFSALL